jgi:hypothetical protein
VEKPAESACPRVSTMKVVETRRGQFLPYLLGRQSVRRDCKQRQHAAREMIYVANALFFPMMQ